MEHFDDQLDRFLNDDRFIAWVTHPDEETNAYWQQWMEENPSQVSSLLQAKEWLSSLPLSSPPHLVQKTATDIWKAVDAQIEMQDNKATSQQPVKKNNWYFMAASVAGLLISIGGYYLFSGKSPAQQNTDKAVIESNFAGNNMLRTNTGTASKVVYLVDGSKITLQPGSSIKHTTFLQKDKREVELQGSAFFDIAKDAQRPFYVYVNNIVLRVLGTSFNVTTGSHNSEIRVLVHTGKVTVYKKGENPEQKNVILAPNQQIIYEAHTQKLIKSTFETALSPPKYTHHDNDQLFRFEETPASDIFSVMEKAYGIPIEYNKKRLAGYKVTSYMSDESFRDKLEIICAAINATYSIGDNKVIVKLK
ncbi:MAG: FecR family protein [Sphingobacteriales bacterium]|nr:FecR family protein [Sphingobacteriales bacterium]